MTLKSRHLLYSLFALLTFGSAFPCMASDIYLAIRGGNGGSGTQSDPFDASSPDAYDGLLMRFTSNTNFHYAPGTYRTRGWSFQQRDTAHAQCRHFGAGIDQTIIQLDGSGGYLLFGADYNHFTDGFELHNLTLDCNAQGNSGFRNHQGGVSAFNANGSNMLFQHLKVINFGTSRQGNEDFVMLIWPPSFYQGQSFNNNTFDDITFTQPATGNSDGASLASIGGPQGISVNGKIINCKFLDCRSDFTYTHAFFANDCENNYVRNSSNGMYFEPNDSRNDTWTVRNNNFENVDYGLYINWHPGAHLGSIIFDNNQVSISNDYVRRAALGVSDDGLQNGDASCSINYIEFNNNTVNLASHSGGQAPASLVSAIDLRSPGHHYIVNQVTGSGNNISLPGNSYNVDAGVVRNLNLH